MSHLEQDPFSEAAQQFNLDKLRRALEESDGLQVTDAPWMQFKGILCGYDAREIAEKLNLPKNASRGISVSLSRDVAPKIRLILDYPKTKKRIDWDKVPRYLLAKGYGIEAEIETIDWSGKCKEVLTFNRELAINLFTSNMGVTIELDQIHVPLGLIERKEKPKIAGDVESKKGSSIDQSSPEQITIKIPHSIFKNEVLPEFKSSSNRIISILGEAGSGKTVQLLKIAQWILEQGDLPIFISLGSIPIKENIKEVKPLRDYLFDDWLKQFSYQVPNQWIKDLEFQLQQGKVWLLLDGADEMVGCSDPLGYLSKSLNITLFQNVKVIVTCRSNLWEMGTNALASLSNKTYRMMRFEYGDNNLEIDTVSQFIDQWFKSSDPDLGKTLRRALDEPGKEQIRDLVTHPLMLSLLCFSWQYLDGKLPDTKASLYENFANAIFELKKGGFPSSTEDRLQLKELLGKLALDSIEKGYKSILSYESVNEILEKHYPRLFDLAIDLNWLKNVGVKSNTRQPVYAFFHPSFQEYFAALAIDDWSFFLNHDNENPNPWKEYNKEKCIYRVFEIKWQEVILMWLGIAEKKEKTAFIDALFDFKDGLIGNFYFYQYQAKFLASLATAEYSHQYTNQLIEWLLERAYRRWSSHPASIIAQEITLKTNKIITLSKLINFLNLNYNQCFLPGVIWSLQHIGIGSLEAISSLNNLIFAYSDYADYAIECLGRIAIGHEETIQLMLYIINNTSNTNFLARQSTKVRAAKALADICPEQKITAINFLLSIVNDENIAFSTICTAAYNLFQIDRNYKQKAIKILVNLYENSDSNNWNTYFQKDKWFLYENIANHLSKIDPNHTVIEKIIEKNKLSLDYPDSIEELIQLMQNSSDISINIGICKKIEDIGKGKDLAIKNLIEFIILNIDKHEKYFPACQTLTLLLETESQIKLTVKELKGYSDNDQCYDVLWYCAQHLSYPEFYRVWYDDLSIENNSDNDSLNQQTTDSFYLITLKTNSLNSIVEQKDLFKRFKNRLIDAIPSDIKPQIKGKIQESQDIADLEAVFIDLKELLQTENIALILGNNKPSQLLQEFCEQLSDFVQIDWNR